MDGDRALHVTPRLVLGLAVMALGIVLILDNLGVLEARDYLRFWPVILIAIGFIRVVECGGRAGGAYLWILAGVALQLDSLHVVRAGQLWPAFLVVVGGFIVWRALARQGARHPEAGEPLGDEIRPSIEQGVRPSIKYGVRAAIGEDAPSSSLSVFVVMGGVRRGTNAQDFQRGDAFAFMGGCEIDLHEASIKNGDAVFDTFALMGGVEIRVPDDWAVENRGFALLGSFEDKTRRPAEAKKRLILTGVAIMGGVEVKN